MKLPDLAGSDELAPELRPLKALNRARNGVADYYVPLADDADEVVRVGAILTMLERGALPWRFNARLAGDARYGAIRVKAFEYFQGIWEHGIAAQVAGTEVEPETVAEARLAQAQLACDDAAVAEAHRQLYLATGEADNLRRELEARYAAGGVEAALPVAVRNVVMAPHDAVVATRLLHLCYDGARGDLIAQIADLFEANELHQRVAAVYRAGARLLAGDGAGARAMLERAARARPTSQAMMQSLTRVAQRFDAEAWDRLGNYPKAYAAYQLLNRSVGGANPDVASFRNRMSSVARLEVPKLPAQDRSHWFTMTGFPRSGTTLLENALAAHPQIETFEELPTRAGSQLYIDRALPAAKTPQQRVAVFVEARRRYYDEMERRMKKPGASIFIDKSPIRSADAGFMAKAFPSMRYVFSIRHPFDVVLSCFKQAFAPNMAMENFRTFEGAASFYDFTMTQWFAAYRMDDPRIHYLKYDDLVTDFEPRMRAVLKFLGADWNAAVLDFASAAQSRASLTPSYQKVRQGLTIGVQSSWRKYAFLFQMPAAKPLYKWAEFFGYPTK